MRDAGKGNNPVAAAAAKDMNPPLPKEWDTCVVFTLPEVAKIFRISRHSAYQAAKRGEIRTVNLGRRKLVPKKVVEDLLIAREGSATTVDKLEGIRNAVREAVGNAVRDTVNRTRQSSKL